MSESGFGGIAHLSIACGGCELLWRDFDTIFPAVGASKESTTQNMDHCSKGPALDVAKEESHHFLLLSGQSVRCAHKKGIGGKLNGRKDCHSVAQNAPAEATRCLGTHQIVPLDAAGGCLPPSLALCEQRLRLCK